MSWSHLFFMKNKKNRINSSQSISVVIPIFGGIEYLDENLEALKNQILQPEEIIFVDSESPDSLKIQKRLEQETLLKIVYVPIKPAYPGEARNIGAEKAKNKWVAFLDLRTIPSSSWLETIFKLSEEGRNDYVGAVRTCYAENFYQKILKASTYGNVSAQTLAGSIVLKDFFLSSEGFLPNVRAGEDLEWIKRVSKKKNIEWLKESLILYKGLSPTLVHTIKKWFWYSYENSKLDILQAEKFFYFFLLIVFTFSFSYSYNFIFAGEEWDQSPYFIPNLNKILWTVSFSIYMLYRGLLKPIFLKEKLTFLLPINWLLVGFLGLIIDIVKAPGRLIGFFNYLLKKNVKT